VVGVTVVVVVVVVVLQFHPHWLQVVVLDDELLVVPPVVCATVMTCPDGFEEPPAPLVVDMVTLVLTPEPLPST
jgi:hypothetical protein